MRTKRRKRSSHPVMFFIYLSVLVIIISGIASALNLQVTYDKLTTIAGEVESTTVAVNSLLSLDGISYLIKSAYDNLKGFIPFTTLLIGAISFGIALKSSYLKVLFARITNKFPKWAIVFVYTLICILLSVEAVNLSSNSIIQDNILVSGNAAFVLLLPLGAVLFMAMNRNPLGGLALGFASIASGYGAGFFVNALDYALIPKTEAAAALVKETVIPNTSNLIFMIVASILIAVVCTAICEKFLVRKLGRNQVEEDDEFVIEESKEKKGLWAVLIATVIYLIPIIIMLLPIKNLPFFGLLLDKSQSSYASMLFSEDTLLMTNFTSILSLLFGLQGFVFGVATGTIRKISDMVNFSTNYLKTIGGIFVLIFFAAQFYGIVTQTNLGVVITGLLANVLSSTNFGYIPLIALLLVFSMLANIFIPEPTTKWTILAPAAVPALLNANITPAFAQLIFRAGDSITNVLTPMFMYFVIFIGFVEVYLKDKNEFSIKRCYKLIIPYFLAIAVVWIALIICWQVIGLPIGPGVYPSV